MAVNLGMQQLAFIILCQLHNTLYTAHSIVSAHNFDMLLITNIWWNDPQLLQYTVLTCHAKTLVADDQIFGKSGDTCWHPMKLQALTILRCKYISPS